jgi:hypothetical protein
MFCIGAGCAVSEQRRSSKPVRAMLHAFAENN